MESLGVIAGMRSWRSCGIIMIKGRKMERKEGKSREINAVTWKAVRNRDGGRESNFPYSLFSQEQYYSVENVILLWKSCVSSSLYRLVLSWINMILCDSPVFLKILFFPLQILGEYQRTFVPTIAD